MLVVDDERRNPIDFRSWGHRSRSTLALCIIHCGHYTDYSFSPITFRLHMYVVEDERRNLIDFGSWGHRSRSTLALCIIHCGHYTDYSFSPITFRLHR